MAFRCTFFVSTIKYKASRVLEKKKQNPLECVEEWGYFGKKKKSKQSSKLVSVILVRRTFWIDGISDGSKTRIGRVDGEDGERKERGDTLDHEHYSLTSLTKRYQVGSQRGVFHGETVDLKNFGWSVENWTDGRRRSARGTASIVLVLSKRKRRGGMDGCAAFRMPCRALAPRREKEKEAEGRGLGEWSRRSGGRGNQGKPNLEIDVLRARVARSRRDWMGWELEESIREGG